MRFKKIVQLYKKHAVSVCGMVGSGKDMLTANVIERRKLPHVSNCPYNSNSMPYDYKAIECGGNTYKDFVENTLKKYDFPYFDGCDFYLSDCGIYFPSQFCNELNRDYKQLPTFMALTRQLGKCHVHYNAQNLNRVWDKIREMADVYIRCNRCIVLFGKIVIQTITIYDKYESAVARVKPCRVSVPLMGKGESRNQVRMYRDNFQNVHGSVKNRLLIYWNKSSYDTRYFKHSLQRGEKNEEEKTQNHR